LGKARVRKLVVGGLGPGTFLVKAFGILGTPGKKGLEEFGRGGKELGEGNQGQGIWGGFTKGLKETLLEG